MYETAFSQIIDAYHNYTIDDFISFSTVLKDKKKKNYKEKFTGVYLLFSRSGCGSQGLGTLNGARDSATLRHEERLKGGGRGILHKAALQTGLAATVTVSGVQPGAVLPLGLVLLADSYNSKQNDH